MSKVKRSIKTKDFHSMHVMRCRSKNAKPLSAAKHAKMIKCMGIAASEILLNEGLIILPWHIGDIFMKGTVRPVIDMEQTVKLKKPVFQFNEHSDGIVYVPYFYSTDRKGHKINTWAFSFYRNSRREIKKLLQSKQVQYPNFMAMLPKKRKGK